eukprot:SAG31_NODE_631_length_13367_cov_6.190648_4_plen_77_part_00
MCLMPNGTFVIRRTLVLHDGQIFHGAATVLTKLLFGSETNVAETAASVQALPTPHGGVGTTMQCRIQDHDRRMSSH